MGFDPVGLVLGTAAFHVGYTSDSECSYRRLSSRSLTVTASRWTPFTGLVDSMYAVRTTALDRMVSECRVRGGDGVVGVTLRAREFPSGTLEFTITGTAVRARSRVRPRRPFTSHLSGQDFARLMHSGWVPTGLAFGISMASRHGTQGTIRQTRRTAGNQEVDGYTGLVSDVRRAARAQLTRAARKNGGDGLVVGDMELRVHEEDCSRGAKDRVAEALIVGTSIARFARPGRQTAPEPLTVMRLER
ncbi:MAG: heavy metal-binding domain-containing protein [Streptomyces sp.]|nr:heavy metal-binding domain-containing protein [Streptomyces sp.]